MNRITSTGSVPTAVAVALALALALSMPPGGRAAVPAGDDPGAVPGPLGPAATDMRDVEGDLGRLETGDPTQATEAEILRKLDKLIEAMEKA